MKPHEIPEAEQAPKTIHAPGTFEKKPEAKANECGACVSRGCSGCGRYGCPYTTPKTLEEARKVESLGGSPSCLTWPPRPPILEK